MVKQYISIKEIDNILHNLYILESVFKFKIDILDKNSKLNNDSFSSLVHTMKEEEQEELKLLQLVIPTIEKLKQNVCTHPKKDHDICNGAKYCMNCNLSLKK